MSLLGKDGDLGGRMRLEERVYVVPELSVSSVFLASEVFFDMRHEHGALLHPMVKAMGQLAL